MKKILITKSDLLKRYRTHVYDAAAEGRKVVSKLGELTCKRGCSNCCRQKVLATVVEGLAIYLYLQEAGRWTPEFKARLVAEDRHATKTAHDEWFKDRRPCPFLEGTECGVYPARPSGCALTFSIFGNPDLCAGLGPPGTGQMQVQVTDPKANDPSPIVQLMLFFGSVGKGIPEAGYMTLPGAVLFAAAFIENTKEPDIFSMSLGEGADGLIERFDAGGKAHDDRRANITTGK